MTSSVYVYCDEYGNTGARLDDSDQPVLLYAFVSMAEQQISDAEGMVRELYSREKAPLGELKSSTLIQSTRGQRRYGAIGRILSDCGASIQFSAVEKRYQACAMIVETFLDPHLNTDAPSELLLPAYRQRMANAFYNVLTDVNLRTFVAAVYSDNPNDIAAIGKFIARIVSLHPDDFVATAARLMDTRPESVFRYLSPGEGVGRGFKPSSQTFAFYGGLQAVDAQLDATGALGVVIRDDDRQNGKWLEVAYSIGQETGPDSPHAYGTFRRLERITECLSADSQKNIGLQFADLAVGIVGRAVSNALRGGGRAFALSDVLAPWALLAPTDASGYWMISDRHMDDVLATLNAGVPGQGRT